MNSTDVFSAVSINYIVQRKWAYDTGYVKIATLSSSTTSYKDEEILISYFSDIRLSEASHVSLMVFDLLGREVARLVDEVTQPGEFSVGWDASAFSSGIYFYRLHTGAFIQTKRMILMR